MNNAPSISHDRGEETIEAKARWFQSLTVDERAAIFDSFTEMILANNPSIGEKPIAQPASGRIRIVAKP